MKGSKKQRKIVNLGQHDEIKEGSRSSMGSSTIKPDSISQQSVEAPQTQNKESAAKSNAVQQLVEEARRRSEHKVKSSSELRREKHMNLIEQTEKMTREIH